MMINPAQIFLPKVNYACPTAFTGRKNSISCDEEKNIDRFEKTISKKMPPYPFSGEEDYKTYKHTPWFIKNKKLSKINIDIKEAAKSSAEAAILLKDSLYKDLDPKTTSFVSIGTSPVGVMRAFEYMGYDVKYVPITKLGSFERYEGGGHVEEYSDMPLHKYYFEFLNSIGLGKEEVNNSDKKYIFYDYTCRGTTLENVERIALYKGLDPKKVEFRSINDDLAEFVPADKQGRMISYTSFYMGGSAIAAYSNVPHLPYDATKEIINMVNEEEKEIEKSFNFVLLDELKKMGKLKK